MRRILGWLGVLLWIVVVIPAAAVLMALWVMLGLVLRVLRPFIVWPLVMGSLGGVGATAYFAANHLWSDALRAGSAGLVCALLLGLYSLLAQTIDPTHFDEVPRRLRWWTDEDRDRW